MKCMALHKMQIEAPSVRLPCVSELHFLSHVCRSASQERAVPESPFSALDIPHPQLDSVMSANGDSQGLPAEPQRQVTF